MRELEELKKQIEQEFYERWEASDGQSLSDLTSILLEIQSRCGKNPNSEPEPSYHRVHESQGRQIEKFLAESGLDCEKLTPMQREKLYLAEVRRLRNKDHRAMIKSLIEFTNRKGILNPESIKRVKNLLIALKPPVQRAQPVSGKKMAEHWQRLFHANPASMHSTFTAEQLKNMNLKYFPSPLMDVNYLPRQHEVADSIYYQSIGKAPGESGLRAEMIKYGGRKIVEILTSIYRDFWCRDHGGKGKPIPDSLIIAKVCPLLKKGSPSDPGNFRSIFLLEVIGKILCRLLIKRIEPIIDAWLRDSQCGFRQQRSTAQAITALTLCQQKAHNSEIELWALFIDISKAFDSPSHDVIEQVLKFIGVPCCVLKMLMNFHKEVEHFVGSKLNKFSCGRGSRQGSVEAPGIFSIVFEFLIRAAKIEEEPECGLYFESETKHSGMKFPSEWAKEEKFRIMDLTFADDWVLLFRSKAAANRTLVRVNTICEQLGIRINVSKTKIMPLALPAGAVDNETELVYCGTEVVQQVEKFLYLGAMFREKEGARISNAAIKHAKLRLYRAQNKLKTLLKTKLFSPRFRSVIVKYYGVGSLLYGCEAWVLTEARIRQLEIALMRLRRILVNKGKYEDTIQGIIRRRNLAWMTRKIFPTSVRDFLSRRRLQFLLQAICTDGSPFLRQLLLSQPDAQRYGRPKPGRTTYLGMIVKDFQWATGIETPLRAKTELPKLFGRVKDASKLEFDRLTSERQEMLEEKKIREIPLVSKFKVRIAHGKRMRTIIKLTINEVFNSDQAKLYREKVGVKFKTEAEAKSKAEKCEETDCWAAFVTKGGRGTHMARAHRPGADGSFAKERQSKKVKCPKCLLSFVFKRTAINHCAKFHKFTLQ
jgi:hypothetical protein